MHAAFLLIVGLGGMALAQTTTTTAAAATSSSAPVSGCGSSIDLIIQSCLATENAQLAACAANDWDCLCAQSTNVATCYNNCPSDPNAFGAQQTQISYCNAAKAYGSTSSSSSATSTGSTFDSSSATSTRTHTTTTDSQSAQTTDSSATTTTTSSPSSSTHNSGSIATAVAPAHLVAAAFGLLAMI